MWYPYRIANCGSTGDLTRLNTKSPVWDPENQQEEEELDEVPQLTNFHQTFISGPCTGNCYPGATQGYPPMYPCNYPANPQTSGMMAGGLQRSSTCGSMLNAQGCCFPSYPYPYPQESVEKSPDTSDTNTQNSWKNYPQVNKNDSTSSTSAKESSAPNAEAKKKYSTDSIEPDATLPPVIRRRNRNLRKKLAVSLLSIVL